MEKTAAAAEVPREDGNTREMPPLQQQITRLYQELGRQESLWADVHRKLQNHIDALRKQNLELREELRDLKRQQWEARKKPVARPHAGRESHTLAWELAFGKISPLPVDEEMMPKYICHKSQSATVLGQRSSSNNLTPPKVMHPSSRSPQNSSGRKSPVQASQATTLQEQTAAAGGADRSSSVLESSEGVFLSHVEADELTGSSPNIEELQNLPVNPPPSLETAQPMDTKMKKEEVQEEKRHPNGKSGFPSQFPGALHAAPSRQATDTGR
uniref:TCP10 n=1 Tax=Theropithecus gelada TaxID=9565 RepID=A0A8D2KAL1_THEGE